MKTLNSTNWSRAVLATPLAIVLSVLVAAVLLAGCSGAPETGPGKVRWDKVSCARCIMAVSDHNYSAQVRGGPAGKRTKLYFFDDIGCAVLWLDQQDWKDDPRTEMWVTDHQNGTWIDAFESYFAKGKITPMDYGLGAQPDSTEGALDYAGAVREIYDREQRLH